MFYPEYNCELYFGVSYGHRNDDIENQTWEAIYLFKSLDDLDNDHLFEFAADEFWSDVLPDSDDCDLAY